MSACSDGAVGVSSNVPVSLVFMGENDQENFSALCALDPNIDAIHQAGRVFFWNDLEGTPREKIDHLAERISHVLMPADTERVSKHLAS